MSINIEHRTPTVKEYQQLRNSTGWDMLDDDTVSQGMKNTLYGVCVFSNKGIIGTGRVIGDGSIYFYIQDVIVLPEYKGKGIGKMIMNEIENYLLKSANKNSFIGLMAAEGVEKFYNKFGYKKRPDDRPGMYKIM
jgi:GNAT superfamily N-acetyltransferase